MRLVSFDGTTHGPAVALAVRLRDGDVVEVEIDGIGTLTNPVRTGSASG